MNQIKEPAAATAAKATETPDQQQIHHLWRPVLIVIGWLSLVLGVIGIFLPLLPTTPFLLLTASCFAKSSPRFHNWLMSHPKLGPPISDWQEYRCIVPATKRLATVLIVLSFGVSVFVVKFLILKIMLICMMTALLIFIWRTADGPQAG